MRKLYEVKKITFDAARPYAVVATFGSFNPIIIARYENEADAERRAREEIRAYQSPECDDADNLSHGQR